jgi:hypothetical protein
VADHQCIALRVFAEFFPLKVIEALHVGVGA